MIADNIAKTSWIAKFSQNMIEIINMPAINFGEKFPMKS